MTWLLAFSGLSASDWLLGKAAQGRAGRTGEAEGGRVGTRAKDWRLRPEVATHADGQASAELAAHGCPGCVCGSQCKGSKSTSERVGAQQTHELLQTESSRRENESYREGKVVAKFRSDEGQYPHHMKNACNTTIRTKKPS